MIPYQDGYNIASAPSVHYGQAFYVFGGLVNTWKGKYEDYWKTGQESKKISRFGTGFPHFEAILNYENLKTLITDLVTESWFLVGSLNYARFGHNVIFDGQHFLVVGGYDEFKNEVCTLGEDKMITCEKTYTYMKYWRFYPELFLVNDTFADHCSQ